MKNPVNTKPLDQKVTAPPESGYILDIRVDATNYEDIVRSILNWGRNGESRYVCAANVHMVMEAFDSADFRCIVNSADMVTPDGMPLVWSLRMLGIRHASRVYGPDLTMNILEMAEKEKVPVGIYGGEPAVLEKLLVTVKSCFKSLCVAYSYSSPFRLLTQAEDDKIINDINSSGVRILFVGLGCPKQERWMSEHAGKINSVMVGVGAAFGFIAGTKPQAPRWLMCIGLEWLFRLITEPQRLWKRYLKHNPRFVLLLALQIIRQRCRK